ncbi:MAG: DNA-formamidopyrimidine glycosylase [Bacillota bacterium]|nr:MAG: DNA-formamidopyrimidine glycosylase [Bacillota bacterium]
MPELPEVETVRRTLIEVIQHETIERVSVLYPNIIHMDQHEFTNLVVGQTIRDLKRKGKYLIFILDKHAMIIHLRMEGKFFLKRNEPILKHEHIIFTFRSGLELRYHDVRKFGTIHLVPLNDYLDTYPISELALEPKDLSVNQFYQSLRNRSITIKQALLDQRIVSGLGNIYVDETLFISKIHPTRKACDINDEEANTILKAATNVLDKAVLLGGTTIRSYTSSLGVHGRFQNELLVHMKQGEPCPRCQTPIIKIRVGGRGTYVCPECQT